MGPRSPSLVWDSARLVEVLGGILVLTTVLVAAMGAVGGLAVWIVRGGGAPAGWRCQTRGWLRRRAARSFATAVRSEEHTSELQSLMRISYAVFCLKNKTNYQ